MNALRTLALAALLGGTGLLALAPTANATHCDETDPACVPHRVWGCIDRICFIIRRPTECTLDLNEPTIRCEY